MPKSIHQERGWGQAGIRE